jgi:hypothetical protein
MDNENEYIFTFGLGTKLKNSFVRIKSSNIEEARKMMFRHHGDMWAFCYPNEEAAGVQEFHLLEVPIGTKNERL